MSVSTTVPGTEFLPMVNGRAWAFAHNGYAYQMVCLNSTGTIKMWYRKEGKTRWRILHSRELNGRSATQMAQEIHAYITA